MSDTNPEVKTSEYKGSPILSLLINEYQGKPQYLSFGKRKAETILNHLDDIKKFVEEN